MEDYVALNRKAKIPTRQINQRDPTTGNTELVRNLAQREQDTPGNITQYINKLKQRHEKTTETRNIKKQEQPDRQEILNRIKSNKKSTTKIKNKCATKDPKNTHMTYAKQTPISKKKTM